MEIGASTVYSLNSRGLVEAATELRDAGFSAYVMYGGQIPLTYGIIEEPLLRRHFVNCYIERFAGLLRDFQPTYMHATDHQGTQDEHLAVGKGVIDYHSLLQQMVV